LITKQQNLNSVAISQKISLASRFSIASSALPDSLFSNSNSAEVRPLVQVMG
jgi:hypothetical protein